MRNRLLPMLAVLVLSAPITRADDGPGLLQREGTVRLASGLSAHYAWSYYQRDGNALANAVSSGDSVVALTDAGALLRFDRGTLRLTKESFSPVAATCLGRGEGDTVLAGFADGRIVRVDPATLEVTELARSTGEVAWVGVTTAGAEEKQRIVAVVAKPRLVVHDVGKGKTHVVDTEPGHPDAFLLDRKGRLWLGWDNGEWSGSCLFVDLATGQVHDIPSPQPKIAAAERHQVWEGVCGFVELRDGQVWAHGGTMHMGGTSGFIHRVDRGRAEGLYHRDNLELIRRETERRQRAEEAEENRAAPAKAAPEPPIDLNRPFLPITQIIEEPGTGAIVVMAFSTMYRTDAKLAGWRKFDELEIGYRAGRRDAVGAYPSVRSVEPIAPAAAGGPMGYLFATRLDGLVRLADGKTTRSTPLAQLAIESTGRMIPSSAGILLFPASDDGQEEGDIWRYRDRDWTLVSFAPPYRANPDAEDEKGAPPDRDWSSTATLVGRDGTIFTVNEVFHGDLGTRTTARWRNGKVEVLGTEVSTLIVRASFVTPDGTLWNARNSILRRFNDGKWVDTDTSRDPHAIPREDWNGLDLRATAVNATGPPWILRDRESERLLRLEYGPDFQAPRLTLVPLTASDLEGRMKVHDAIAWTKETLLLATDVGLRTFTIGVGKGSSHFALDTGGRPVTHLARDGRGRLWLGGGQGLVMLGADGKTLHPLDAVPRLGRSKVEALVADPDHSDGVIAAIADRGVVFLLLPHAD
ncbi:MAG: NHL repeat-containing protein [Isosphaeraceae bacterium]